ncbi:PTS system glucitol/sorbitol-specific IIA component [Paraburkholderia phenoliruptrix]|uniref:PTS glucitol/sorbitol transporter subunit IIA n=1 Tax=Paraburkholderia phenoliruptrix TaxID=252970 RepID=UPI0028593DFB|nr:PTS glucitol/sorbitol transporter subunit IIA [Paraburkholderia phenoliruptrix]MDR6423106.1 PTS system glucitol/sorbitol-specific IIA component [Paraburkholderia phenoliruptrix]
MNYYRTVISSIGEEVQSLLEGGVLILYADGAPPELAEVSVLHRVQEASRDVPRIGSVLRIGEDSAVVTAVGSSAWNKVSELGHVVINFNGSQTAERPGEICVSEIDCARLFDCMKSGTVIEILGA